MVVIVIVILVVIVAVATNAYSLTTDCSNRP